MPNASPATRYDSVPSKYAVLHARFAAYLAAESERRQPAKAEDDEFASHLADCPKDQPDYDPFDGALDNLGEEPVEQQHDDHVAAYRAHEQKWSDAVLEALGNEDFDTLNRLCPPKPKAAPTFLERLRQSTEDQRICAARRVEANTQPSDGGFPSHPGIVRNNIVGHQAQISRSRY
jgi:hypothetical protein